MRPKQANTVPMLAAEMGAAPPNAFPNIVAYVGTRRSRVTAESRAAAAVHPMPRISSCAAMGSSDCALSGCTRRFQNIGAVAGARLPSAARPLKAASRMVGELHFTNGTLLGLRK